MSVPADAKDSNKKPPKASGRKSGTGGRTRSSASSGGGGGTGGGAARRQGVSSPKQIGGGAKRQGGGQGQSSGKKQGKTTSGTKSKQTAGRGKKDETPHLVRVTLLGLAGITLSSDECENDHAAAAAAVNSQQPEKSPPELAARAVVALSREGIVQGKRSCLSAPLSRSRAEDVTVLRRKGQQSGGDQNSAAEASSASAGSSEGSGSVTQVEVTAVDDEGGQNAAGGALGRYVAVWETSQEDEGAADVDGATATKENEAVKATATVTFETGLRPAASKLDRHRRQRSRTDDCASDEWSLNSASVTTVTTSMYAPKSFEVCVALAVDANDANDEGNNGEGDKETKVVPLGIAALAVSGEECRRNGGAPLYLDLPVLSLEQARPTPLVGAGGPSPGWEFPEIDIGTKTKRIGRAEEKGAMASQSRSTTEEGKLGPHLTEPQGTEKEPPAKEDDGASSPLAPAKGKKKKKGRLGGLLFRRKSRKSVASAEAEVKSNDADGEQRAQHQKKPRPPKFAIDPVGGAVLRIAVEVCEKGSDLEKTLEARRRGELKTSASRPEDEDEGKEKDEEVASATASASASAAKRRAKRREASAAASRRRRGGGAASPTASSGSGRAAAPLSSRSSSRSGGGKKSLSSDTRDGGAASASASVSAALASAASSGAGRSSSPGARSSSLADGILSDEDEEASCSSSSDDDTEGSSSIDSDDDSDSDSSSDGESDSSSSSPSDDGSGTYESASEACTGDGYSTDDDETECVSTIVGEESVELSLASRSTAATRTIGTTTAASSSESESESDDGESDDDGDSYTLSFEPKSLQGSRGSKGGGSSGNGGNDPLSESSFVVSAGETGRVSKSQSGEGGGGAVSRLFTCSADTTAENTNLFVCSSPHASSKKTDKRRRRERRRRQSRRRRMKKSEGREGEEGRGDGDNDGNGGGSAPSVGVDGDGDDDIIAGEEAAESSSPSRHPSPLLSKSSSSPRGVADLDLDNGVEEFEAGYELKRRRSAANANAKTAGGSSKHKTEKRRQRKQASSSSASASRADRRDRTSSSTQKSARSAPGKKTPSDAKIPRQGTDRQDKAPSGVDNSTKVASRGKAAAAAGGSSSLTSSVMRTITNVLNCRTDTTARAVVAAEAEEENTMDADDAEDDEDNTEIDVFPDEEAEAAEGAGAAVVGGAAAAAKQPKERLHPREKKTDNAPPPPPPTEIALRQVSSLGELTTNTLDRLELQRMQDEVEESAERERLHAASTAIKKGALVGLPVAFGGEGLCATAMRGADRAPLATFQIQKSSTASEEERRRRQRQRRCQQERRRRQRRDKGAKDAPGVVVEIDEDGESASLGTMEEEEEDEEEEEENYFEEYDLVSEGTFPGQQKGRRSPAPHASPDGGDHDKQAIARDPAADDHSRDGWGRSVYQEGEEGRYSVASLSV